MKHEVTMTMDQLKQIKREEREPLETRIKELEGEKLAIAAALPMRDTVIAQLSETVNKQKARIKEYETAILEMVKFENGYILTKKAIESRIDECDCLLPVHHENLPPSKAQTVVEGIVEQIERVKAKVLYAHCYAKHGVTNLLVKYPPGMDKQKALEMVISATKKARGVSRVKEHK